MNTKEKAEIWKEYFDKLLNTEEPRELIKKGNKEFSEVEVVVEIHTGMLLQSEICFSPLKKTELEI